MTQLVEALDALGLDGEIALAGYWVTLHGDRCAVYVAEAAPGFGFYSWCDDPAERALEAYYTAFEAIEAGLRRAATANEGG